MMDQMIIVMEEDHLFTLSYSKLFLFLNTNVFFEKKNHLWSLLGADVLIFALTGNSSKGPGLCYDA